MILEDLLKNFDIQADLPEYLLSQTFNEVFLDGDLTIENGNYKITVKTRQDVLHQMFIRSDDEFPVVIMSELPTGLLNGMKFGKNPGEEISISKL